MSPVAMTLLLVLSAAFFSWSAFRRMRQLAIGAPDPSFSLSGEEAFGRIQDVIVYAFAQKKMPYYPVAGFAHMAIFGGFVVLLLNSIVLWVRGYDPSFDAFGILAAGAPLGDLYSLVKDVFVVAVIAGATVFVYLRVVAKEQRMTLGVEGLVILGIIIVMMVAELLYSGSRLALEARFGGLETHFRVWEPASSVVAMMLSGVESDSTLTILEHVGFWTHSSLVLIFGNILPYSKHFHIITAIPNVFTRDRTPHGRLPKVDDLEGRVEREEPVGIAKVQDLSWKHILDLYTCTECGRCSDNCPAYTTGKKLSPKHLTLALRDHLFAAEDNLFGKEDGVSKLVARQEPVEGEKEPLHTTPPAPKDGYFLEPRAVDLVPNVIDPEVLWACTSCRACEEQCPVMISYVDKIVGMRRDLVMMKSEFPPDLERAFRGMETNGNPWNYSASDRANWADGLGVPLLEDHPDAQYLYWVGCAASFDDRAKKIARATAQLLLHANIDFAIMGTSESCTGDPARRAGNEYLFQMLANNVVESLKEVGAEKKVILTTCPHCFNTLKNEYPDFGGHYEVVHHSDFLNGLVARGQIVPTKPVKGKLAYHDACYLGRYNDVYESPRAILERIPGVELVEVPYWNRSKGLCCGAGGAQMFMEEMEGKQRVNTKRTLQLVETGAKTIATGCPFCATMIGDGIKSTDMEESVTQLDLAELLLKSVELRGVEAAE